MKLSLIRHGITIGVVERLYYGSTDLPLLEESAEELKKNASEGVYPKADLYFTSGMLRAEQSFEAIYGSIPHGILPGMREINLGAFEMRPFDELKNDPAFLEWISGDNESNVCPGGESGKAVTERALKALEPIINGDLDAVVITHGGVIGGVLASYFPNPDGRYAFSPEPGHGYTVEFRDGKPCSCCPI